MPKTHNLRTIAMPTAMLVGALFCRQLNALEAWTGNMIAPSMIFLMLFFTFCRIDVRRMRFTWLYFWLLLFQLAGSVAVYFLLLSFDPVVAQGAMVCVLAPVAMAAVVIGGMLGANIEMMAVYTFMCHAITAFAAPLVLHFAGGGSCSLGMILSKVAPLLLAPFVAGQLCRFAVKPVCRWVVDHSYLSFYIWVVSLLVIIGRTTAFILDRDEGDGYTEIVLAAVSLVVCFGQFAVGKWLGGRYGDRAAGGQMLGQKNTVLAVWMAQSFLNPLSSIAPTAYIVWQNLVNSWQLYRREHQPRHPERSERSRKIS